MPEIIAISLDAIDYGGLCEKRNHEAGEESVTYFNIVIRVFVCSCEMGMQVTYFLLQIDEALKLD